MSLDEVKRRLVGPGHITIIDQSTAQNTVSHTTVKVKQIIFFISKIIAKKTMNESTTQTMTLSSGFPTKLHAILLS